MHVTTNARSFTSDAFQLAELDFRRDRIQRAAGGSRRSRLPFVRRGADRRATR